MTFAARLVNNANDPALVPFRFRERQLNTRPHRRGDLDGAQFVAEGDLVVMRALASGYKAATILCGAEQLASLEPYATQLQHTDVVVADESVRREATGLGVALSIIGLFLRPPLASLNDVSSRHTKIILLSQIDNPTNVGAIMRSAMAFGFHGVLLDGETSDPFGRRALRVSMGTSFAADICRTTDVSDALSLLHNEGFVSCALTPHHDATPLIEVTAPEKLVLLLGSERDGLADSLLSSATLRVRIAMSEGIDSLNVAAAAAVACYGLTSRNG